MYRSCSFRAFSLFIFLIVPLAHAGPHLYANASACSTSLLSTTPPTCASIAANERSITLASSVIVASSLQPYCTALLGYTTPGATTTTTENSTPTSTIYEISYTSTTYRSTVYYEETVTQIVTLEDDMLRRKKRADATLSPAPTALATFDSCVVSSACARVATVNTSTVTANNIVSFTLTTETTATTFLDSVLYIPTGTVTTTVTPTILCGALGRENTLFALPPAGDGNVLTDDRSAGSENCSISAGQSYIYQNPGSFLLSVAVGKRANGRMYCDWFQYSAREMRAKAATIEGAPEGWEYWDKGCFEG